MSLPVVLFVDGTAPKPYDPHTLATEGLGGTEATVIRVAEGLTRNYPTEEQPFRVTVEQHNRTGQWFDGEWNCGALYGPPDSTPEADYVVSLRYPALVPLMQKRFPRAKHFLWLHDLLAPDFARQLVGLSNFTAIAVSNFHKTQMQEQLFPQGYTGQFPIKVVYNPIDDSLGAERQMNYDKNKLVFFSSPHKGIEYTLKTFERLKEFNPNFRLYIANPGYLPDAELPEGVVNLGSLPHSEIMKHVHGALCVLYPNPIFPETMGLILAEANAVGTPVIAHRMGAAPEVLYHPQECFDCRDPKRVIDRVMSWYGGDRPRVRAQEKFRLSNVIQSWIKVLSV